MVAAALRFELEDVRYTRGSGACPGADEIAVGTVDPGTIAVTKIRFAGVARGREVLVNEFVWRISDDVVRDWERGDKWILQIDGDPTMRSEVHAMTQTDAQRPTSLTVAMAAERRTHSVRQCLGRATRSTCQRGVGDT